MKEVIFIVLLLPFIIISCVGKGENAGEDALISAVREVYGFTENDSISTDLLYGNGGIVDRSKILQIEEVDKVGLRFDKESKAFRDSLINTINKDSLPQIEDKQIASLLQKTLNGDINSYCILKNKPVNCGIPQYVYALYIAEKYDYALPFGDIYFYFYRQNHYNAEKVGKRTYGAFNGAGLKHVSINERNLALYCLIQSYKKGNPNVCPDLSHYFREGMYMEKDVITADRLDSIYFARF